MRDLLQSVKSGFFHEVLCYRDAESRLEGRQGAYLLRESDVKAGIFVISYVNSSSVSHILVPNEKGKYIRQSLEQAVDIAADIIASTECPHPVPPPSQTSSGSTESEASSSASDNESSRCYCCSFVTDKKKTLDSHHKLHKLVKCNHCSKYFKPWSFTSHKRHCNNNAKLTCGLCGYETVHSRNMRAHHRIHITRPHLCRVGDCKRCFKSDEELQNHMKYHLVEGYPCEHCDMKFRHRYERTRHVIRIHRNVRRSSSIGFGLFGMAGVILQRKKGREMISCTKEGCKFKTRAYRTERMVRHVAAKHPLNPRPKKPHQCQGCKKAFAFPYLLNRHEKICKMVRSNTKRIVPMVTNQSLLAIKKKYVDP